jgi:hypothetical protein
LRQRYREEVRHLVEDLLDGGETTTTHLAFGLLRSALRERARSLRSVPRLAVALGGVALALAVGLSLLATSVIGGGGLAPSVSGPTKGTVPFSPNGTVNPKQIPDFVVTVGRHSQLVGYVPRADLFPQPGTTFQPPAVMPVFAGDLKTLVGHMYPGVGYVPLGTAVGAEPCLPETVVENGGSRPVACPSATVVLPNVAGMVTPSAVAELSGLGFDVAVVNVRSRSTPADQVVSMSPAPGKGVHARAVVTIRNSLGPPSSVTRAAAPGTVVTIPNVVGMSEPRASRVITSLGLDVRIAQLPMSGGPADVVIEQEPAAGSRMPSGSLIELTASDS